MRLCFQAYIVLPDVGYKALTPVVSDPIYDKKSINELVICRMCRCSGVVTGSENIILLCEKVAKEDIKIRFFEEDDNQTVIWESFGEFTPNDVHKNTAIAFKTPRYHKDDVDKNAKVSNKDEALDPNNRNLFFFFADFYTVTETIQWRDQCCITIRILPKSRYAYILTYST